MKKISWVLLVVAMLVSVRSGFAQESSPGFIPDDAEAGRSIWVDKLRQRVYAFDHGKLAFEAICSTAAHHVHWAPGDGEYEMPVTPLGSYRVFEKTPDHYSKAYEVHMFYALFYDGGRAIHATYRSEYRDLGRPASGGCVRLTRSKAIELYSWAQVGDPVHVVNGLPVTLASIVRAAHPRPVLVLRSHRAPMLAALGTPAHLRRPLPDSTAAMLPADSEIMEPTG